MCDYYMTGAPEGSQKVVYGGAGNRTCDPWFTRHRFIPYITAASSVLERRLVQIYRSEQQLLDNNQQNQTVVIVKH